MQGTHIAAVRHAFDGRMTKTVKIPAFSGPVDRCYTSMAKPTLQAFPLNLRDLLAESGAVLRSQVCGAPSAEAFRGF